MLLNNPVLFKTFGESGGVEVFLHMVLSVYRTGQERVLEQGLCMMVDLGSSQSVATPSAFLPESGTSTQQINGTLSQANMHSAPYLQAIMTMVWGLELTNAHGTLLDMFSSLVLGQESTTRLFRQLGGV